MTAKERLPQIDDNFGYEYGALEYTLPIKNVEAEELPCSCNYSFQIGCAADIILLVNRMASNHMKQELFTFIYASTLNA